MLAILVSWTFLTFLFRDDGGDDFYFQKRNVFCFLSSLALLVACCATFVFMGICVGFCFARLAAGRILSLSLSVTLTQSERERRCWNGLVPPFFISNFEYVQLRTFVRFSLPASSIFNFVARAFTSLQVAAVPVES